MTHWCTGGDKAACDAGGFCRQYVMPHLGTDDADFYVGYYIHLLSDRLWHAEKIEPLRLLGAEQIRQAKRRWKSADRHFLSRNEAFRPISVLQELPFHEKPWLPYYPEGTVTGLVERIVSSRETILEDRTAADGDDVEQIKRFIDEAVLQIASKLKVPGI
jgi:hypothetical protein